MKGILLVDKPSGMTSHDVVDCVRRASGIRRVGHTGTLDPRATGLLILCLGGATRLSEHLTRLDKTYEGTMRLGVVTDSYDLDGQVLDESPVPDLDIAGIQRTCEGFTGALMQVPPMVSAVKVGGERLYKMARQGETVAREPRPVTVHEFLVMGYEPPDVLIRVGCTSGTYVRSLCHEVGQLLGCGAALASLTRTRVGRHTVENAVSLDALTGPEAVKEHLVPVECALDLPSVVVRSAARKKVTSGIALNQKDLEGTCPVREGWVQVKTDSGALLALGLVQTGPIGVLIHPKRVLAD